MTRSKNDTTFAVTFPSNAIATLAMAFTELVDGEGTHSGLLLCSYDHMMDNYEFVYTTTTHTPTKQTTQKTETPLLSQEVTSYKLRRRPHQ